MTEREKPPLAHFPAVPKEEILDLRQKLVNNPDLIVQAWEEVAMDKDPVFCLGIETIFEEMLQDQSVTKNEIANGANMAAFVWLALEQLASRQGISLPIVTLDTLEAFVDEWRHSPEFNKPSVLTYCEENPALMTYMALQEVAHPGAIRGGLIAYELKRRQFFSKEMARRFPSGS